MLFLRHKSLSGLYAILIALYLLQIELTPVDKKTLTKYHVNTAHYKLIILTIAVPYIVIWLITLVGYLRLQAYVKLIKNDKDGAAFRAVGQGILWLGLWLPISTIIGNFFSQYYSAHPSSTANLVRLDNYLTLVMLGLGFFLVSLGANKLLQLVKKPSLGSSQAVTFAYIAFAALYVFLVLQDPVRQFPTKSVGIASYYEPDWLLIITLIIPRLIYWFLGVQAVHAIYLFRKKVKGKLYQRALSDLAVGLAGVVGVTIALRCLQSLSSPLGHLSLGLLLGIVYILLIFIGVGYIFIARGAKKLQQLEEL